MDDLFIDRDASRGRKRDLLPGIPLEERNGAFALEIGLHGLVDLQSLRARLGHLTADTQSLGDQLAGFAHQPNFT